MDTRKIFCLYSMNRIFLSVLLSTVLLSCNGTVKRNESKTETSEIQDTAAASAYVEEYGVDVTDCTASEGRIKDGEVVTSLLSKLGVEQRYINQIVQLHDTLFNPRTLRAGNQYVSYCSGDSAHPVKYWVYSHSCREFTVFDFTDSLLRVSKYIKPIDRVKRNNLFIVKSSLWKAIEDSDLNPNLALKLSDIFAWTVDFFGLQKGDEFRVFYDELFVDSVSVGIDSIYAASFTRDTVTRYAIYYGNGDVKGYWELNGDNIKKAFLKAPLSFSRISSHFSYTRRHPVYKTVRPHTGVDYAAPVGTPVMSIGDGVVIERGYKGGGGNTVKIRHNSIYTTAYLHLSKFGKGISVGNRVVQGQIIGYVGNTGTSTGPHLDFRVWQNGTPIDPLKLESPPSEPLPATYHNEFDSIADIYKIRLDSIR